MTDGDRTLSPKQREAAKTDAQRAEDVAYTINHAIACTVTDLVDPIIGDLTQKHLNKRYHIGCSDPTHNHGPDNPPHKQWQWWVGEVVGDFGAVPLTIAAQRYAPGFMQGLRTTLGTVLGPIYHLGAEHSAKAWARERGIAVGGKEYDERVKEIYTHEVDHLPQAAMWTASSMGINVITQKLVGNHGPWWQIGLGKLAGASISIAAVLGARAAMPETVRSLDQWTSRNLFLPATKTVGKAFGVDEKSVERMAQRDEKAEYGTGWRERVNAEASSSTERARD